MIQVVLNKYNLNWMNSNQKFLNWINSNQKFLPIFQKHEKSTLSFLNTQNMQKHDTPPFPIPFSKGHACMFQNRKKLLRTFTVHFIPYLPRLTLLLILSPETMSTVLIQRNYRTQLLNSLCTGYYWISLRLNPLI